MWAFDESRPGGGADEAPGEGEGTFFEPHLVIPYFPGDTGTTGPGGKRDFPAGVIDYLCPSIKINGAPYNGAPLPRNQTVSVTIEVANTKNKGMWAMVSLYWTDPTAVFTGNALHNGSDDAEVGPPQTLYVPAGGKASFNITFTPLTKMPNHVCLLAEVTSSDDPAPGTFDVSDRHYACHNLNLLTVAQNRVSTINFFVANPFDTEAEVLVRLRPEGDVELAQLRRLYSTEPVRLREEAFRIHGVGDGRMREAGRELTFPLAAGTRQLCQMLVSTNDLRAGQFSAVRVDQEVKQNPTDGTGARRGSLGVVIFPERG
ncbi:MAG: hypothetical protein JWM59_1441 [Verrucomicrobiales bacterium]|nr:hypothetical protein [Verrucomicrobiales bacterium]